MLKLHINEYKGIALGKGQPWGAILITHLCTHIKRCHSIYAFKDPLSVNDNFFFFFKRSSYSYT